MGADPSSGTSFSFIWVHSSSIHHPRCSTCSGFWQLQGFFPCWSCWYRHVPSCSKAIVMWYNLSALMYDTRKCPYISTCPCPCLSATDTPTGSPGDIRGWMNCGLCASPLLEWCQKALLLFPQKIVYSDAYPVQSGSTAKNANTEPDVVERVHDVLFASGSGFERRAPCKFIGGTTTNIKVSLYL